MDDDVDDVDSGREGLEDGDFDIGLKPIGGGRDGGKKGKKKWGKVGKAAAAARKAKAAKAAAAAAKEKEAADAKAAAEEAAKKVEATATLPDAGLGRGHTRRHGAVAVAATSGSADRYGNRRRCRFSHSLGVARWRREG